MRQMCCSLGLRGWVWGRKWGVTASQVTLPLEGDEGVLELEVVGEQHQIYRIVHFFFLF